MITLKDNKCIEKKNIFHFPNVRFDPTRSCKCVYTVYVYTYLYVLYISAKALHICIYDVCTAALGVKKGHCVRIATKAPNVIFHTRTRIWKNPSGPFGRHFSASPSARRGNNTTSTTSGVKSLKFIPAG